MMPRLGHKPAVNTLSLPFPPPPLLSPSLSLSPSPSPSLPLFITLSLSLSLSRAEENGFNPVWNEECEFDIINPDLALLRFAVHDEDVFGDSTFIGQAVFPVPCIKSGYRSIQLKNAFNEELDLSSLLVQVEMVKTYADEEVNTTAR